MKKTSKSSLIGLSALFLVIVYFQSIYSYSATKPKTQFTLERTITRKSGSFPSEAIEIIGYKNLQSDSFPIGFMIEVKNISTKPIYYLSFAINFEDYKPHGIPFLLKFNWGDSKLRNNSKMAEQSAPSISPGQVITLRLDPRTERNYENHFKGNSVSPKKLLLVPQIINFGDGTGYQLGTPYPRKSQIKRPNQLGLLMITLEGEGCSGPSGLCGPFVETDPNPFSCPGCSISTWTTQSQAPCKEPT